MGRAREHDDRTEIAEVRGRAQSSPQTADPCVRVIIRVDHWPDRGELDFSLVAWRHPEARLVSNRVWASYDKWHHGMAALDMVAHIYSILDITPDPFP